MSRNKKKKTLAQLYPELAKEWHPIKNKSLKPDEVTAGSGKKVWWMIEYYDRRTQKTYCFEWKAAVVHRVNGTGCPYLSGNKVWKGYNDLESQYPELAKEWHPEKNGDLKPDMVSYGSGKKVWWAIKYYDQKTKQTYWLEWQAAVIHRIDGTGCPYLTGKKILKGFNDLESRHPELAKEWHPEKNGDLKPDMVTTGSRKKVWWRYTLLDLQTGKSEEFEWKAAIHSRVKGSGCPHLSGTALKKGYNDLESRYPELAKEWHPEKNGDLKPDMVTIGSKKIVWWGIHHYDSKQEKTYWFEWKAKVDSRVRGDGCPYLSGKRIWKGFNDLESRYPELAREWHPEKNGNLKPDMVTPGLKKLVWWQLDYLDPKTEKIIHFEWQATISSRVKGSGCPYLSGKKVWKGYNDLESQYPELAKEWHPIKNGALRPDMVTWGSRYKAWWRMEYIDPISKKKFQFEWQAIIELRVKGNGCPYLSGKKVWKGYNDLESRYPELAREWHPEKNGNLKPDMIVAGSSRKVWWKIEYFDAITGKIHCFEWRDSILNRTQGSKCPFLTGRKVQKGYNDLESQYPELAGEWHLTKNRQLTPDKISVTSKRDVWWKCPKCENSWLVSVSVRVNAGYGCPKCGYKAMLKK